MGVFMFTQVMVCPRESRWSIGALLNFLKKV